MKKLIVLVSICIVVLGHNYLCYSATEMPTMISAESGATYTWVNAVNYCRNLSAGAQYVYETWAADATTYTDWRLPSAEELSLFEKSTMGTNWLWTATGYNDHVGRWVKLGLSDGHWGYNDYGGSNYVRCVR